MRNLTILALISFFTASGSLFAFFDIFVEIGPSDKPEGYHTKLKIEKQGADKLLLTLPQMDGAKLEAWLVVCEKVRKKGQRNFRYEVHWPESKAKKPDIALVTPIKFNKDGIAKIHVTKELGSRSYVVFGGHFDDGTFYTVDLPSFIEAM